MFPMLYAVLCYNDEKAVSAWSKEEDDACMARLGKIEDAMKAKGKLGPVARLLPTSSATTLRKSSGEPLIIDGPFAETKEQFLGFYLADCDTLEEAILFAKDLAAANPGAGGYEIRPVALFHPSEIG
jgi:hypothetical protein